MTEKQALEVKDLAKPCNKALGVITERACIVCNGTGRFPYVADLGKDPCSRCHGTGRVGWKWKPEVNQTVLYDKKLMFIVSVGKTRLSLLPFDIPYLGEPLDDYVYVPEMMDVVPILEWQEIERVLEGVEYFVDTRKLTPYQTDRKELSVSEIYLINSPQYISHSTGESRQEAVMRAVIKLGEELDAKSK